MTGKSSTFDECQQRQTALQTPTISLSRLKGKAEGQKNGAHFYVIFFRQ